MVRLRGYRGFGGVLQVEQTRQVGLIRLFTLLSRCASLSKLFGYGAERLFGQPLQRSAWSGPKLCEWVTERRA